MRVTKATVRRGCAVCERTLLQGEYALRFSPDGVEFVDVCPLCTDIALDYGWVREGGPMSPAISSHARLKRPRWAQLLGVGNGESQPVVPEPVLRRAFAENNRHPRSARAANTAGPNVVQDFRKRIVRWNHD